MEPFDLSMKDGNGLEVEERCPGSVKACAVGREGVVWCCQKKVAGGELCGFAGLRVVQSMQSAGGCAGREARQLPATAESTVTVIA